MKKSFFIILLCLISFVGIAQVDSTKQEKKGQEIFSVVEHMPSFVGGDKALTGYIASNSVYTENAKKDSISGVVYVSFLVDVDSTILNPVVIKGLHPELDSISLVLVKKMPKWNPAIQRGRPVKCQFTLPVEYNFYKNKIEETEGFIISKYWSNKGKEKMMQACIKDYKKLFSDCNCWYYFIVWNYNENKLNDLDLQTIFEKQICQ